MMMICALLTKGTADGPGHNWFVDFDNGRSAYERMREAALQLCFLTDTVNARKLDGIETGQKRR